MNLKYSGALHLLSTLILYATNIAQLCRFFKNEFRQEWFRYNKILKNGIKTIWYFQVQRTVNICSKIELD